MWPERSPASAMTRADAPPVLASPALRPRGHLDLRSRQHALSVGRAALAAGGRADHAVPGGDLRPRRHVGPRAAEVLLPCLRHDAERPDGRARHRADDFLRSRTRSTCRCSIPIPCWARPSRRCPAASSSSPTARASTPTTCRASSASATISRKSSTSSRPTSCPSPRRGPMSASSTLPDRPRQGRDVRGPREEPRRAPRHGHRDGSRAAEDAGPFREAHEQTAVEAGHVDFSTTDLAGFLESLLPADRKALLKAAQAQRRPSPDALAAPAPAEPCLRMRLEDEDVQDADACKL